mgnify:CR=1 FL=1
MADSILEQLMGQLSGGAMQQMSQSLGADEDSTRKGLGAALPVLITALQRNASQPGGADALKGALERDHDGGILDDLGGFLNSPQRGNGAGILGHVLGGRRGNVEQGLAKSTGMDLSQMGGLLEMAAPLVMGALGKKQREGSLGSGGLADLLGGEREAVRRREPEATDLLTSMLDEDGDGSVMDDIAGKLGKGLLDRFLGGR